MLKNPPVLWTHCEFHYLHEQAAGISTNFVDKLIKFHWYRDHVAVIFTIFWKYLLALCKGPLFSWNSKKFSKNKNNNKNNNDNNNK